MHRLVSAIRRLARLVRGGAPHADTGPAPGGVAVHDGTPPPDAVTEYWTDERIREARPREQRLDPPGDPQPPGSRSR